MYWNYRVFCCDDGVYPYYEIHEVYYEDDGSIQHWTEGSISPLGDTLDELRADLGYMQEALEAPVLMEKGGKLVEVEGEKE